VAANWAKPIYEKMSAEKTERLIEWNVDVLHRLLKQIVARRRAELGDSGELEAPEAVIDKRISIQHVSGTTIDEVAEIITLPKFNAKAAIKQEDPDSVDLPPHVVDQLYDYVFNIAGTCFPRALYGQLVSLTHLNANILVFFFFFNILGQRCTTTTRSTILSTLVTLQCPW